MNLTVDRVNAPLTTLTLNASSSTFKLTYVAMVVVRMLVEAGSRLRQATPERGHVVKSTHRKQPIAFLFSWALMALVLGCSTGNTDAGSAGKSGGGVGGATAGAGGATSSATGGTGAGGAATSIGTARGGATGGTSATGGNAGGVAGRATGGSIGIGSGGTTGGTAGSAKGGSAGSSWGGASGGLSGSAAGGAAGTAGNATGGVVSSSDGTGGSAGSHGRDAAIDANNAVDANRDTDDAADGGIVDAANMPGTHNPALSGYNAAPNVVLFDNTFYIYPTTDGFASWASTSFSVFSSTNLIAWTSRGVILDLPKDLAWATSHAWAPSIARVGGTYYFYFSADSQLGVATGSSPTGPFKDALGKPLATTRQYGPQSIDPYAFIDDDGTPYLYFGSGSSGLRVVKLNADMISFSGTPTNISPSGASGTLEGSVMFKRNGTYYLAWSEGDTLNATYQMAYARAQSPLGPFTRLGVILQQDTTLGIQGPGGGTVLAIPSRDEYYLVYHRFKIPGGDGTHREVCIDRMTFSSDGTITAVKPSLEGLQTAVLP